MSRSKNADNPYITIAVSMDVKESVRAEAKRVRRSLAQHSAEIFELGLAEYERRTEVERLAR